MHKIRYAKYRQNVGGNAKEEKMNFPKFQSDFLITVKKPFPKVYVEELLVKKLLESDLTIVVKELDRERSYTSGEWISSSSFINLYIGENFLENHYKPDSN